jgi:regulatory protein
MSENILYKTALSKTMALCSRREYCINDILLKLQTWGVNDNNCEKIIMTLRKDNFINEKRYSEAFVRDKFNYNKWGKVKIAAYLKIKNISSEIIKNALNSIDNELYKDTLREIIFSHRRSIKAKNQYDLKGKLLRFGLSKGFESNLLYDILNDLK